MTKSKCSPAKDDMLSCEELYYTPDDIVAELDDDYQLDNVGGTKGSLRVHTYMQSPNVCRLSYVANVQMSNGCCK